MASRSNTVSVGSSFMQRTISDLAPGIEDTDAVNVSQLDDAARVSNRGIAGVSALAALPSIEPGKKFSAGLGVGYYENESAIGKIGTDHDEKSGQTTIKLRRSWGRSGSWADETVVCPLFSPVFSPLFSPCFQKLVEHSACRSHRHNSLLQIGRRQIGRALLQ